MIKASLESDGPLALLTGGALSPHRRTRSLHGPCPVTTFGPKACVLQNPQTIM